MYYIHKGWYIPFQEYIDGTPLCHLDKGRIGQYTVSQLLYFLDCIERIEKEGRTSDILGYRGENISKHGESLKKIHLSEIHQARTFPRPLQDCVKLYSFIKLLLGCYEMNRDFFSSSNIMIDQNVNVKLLDTALDLIPMKSHILIESIKGV